MIIVHYHKECGVLLSQFPVEKHEQDNNCKQESVIEHYYASHKQVNIP